MLLSFLSLAANDCLAAQVAAIFYFSLYLSHLFLANVRPCIQSFIFIIFHLIIKIIFYFLQNIYPTIPKLREQQKLIPG